MFKGTKGQASQMQEKCLQHQFIIYVANVDCEFVMLIFVLANTFRWNFDLKTISHSFVTV